MSRAYVHWPSAYAFLLEKCPAGKPRDQLLALAEKKCPMKLKKDRIKIPRALKIKRDSLPKLKKELDRVFSIFIRTRDARGEVGACRTCGMSHPSWKEMDCGHYVPRQDMATRWEEKNCHLQCKYCNGFRGGEPEKMAAYIDETYGAGTARALREQSKSFRPTRIWLESRIKYYKLKISE